MRVALVLLVALLALSGCASPAVVAGGDGSVDRACRRGVTRTFWVPCDGTAEPTTWRA